MRLSLAPTLVLIPALALVRFLAGGPAAALDLALPAGAVLTGEAVAAPGLYLMPSGRFGADSQPVDRLEGRVTRRTWRIDGTGDALGLLQAIRSGLVAKGFDPGFACFARECGGFDFRYGTEIADPPQMEVDLADFHFLRLARGAEAVSVLVSRSRGVAYLQVIAVEPMPAAAAGPGSTEAPEPGQKPQAEAGVAPEVAPGLAPEVAPGPASASDDLARALERDGRAVLEGLAFAPGGTALDPGSTAILAELAAMMAAQPDLTLVLVGHSDADGPLEANIRVSRARAATVRQALIAAHGVDPARLTAEGAGFLAPRASNATADGRALNRRVEAVVR